jgi:self-protective colicin-like immunity protein
MNRSDISNWVSPRWHRDFGDPDVELQMLKAFCMALYDRCPDCELSLDCHEEGYMSVSISRNGIKSAELHVVRGKDALRYGLFRDGGENEKRVLFRRNSSRDCASLTRVRQHQSVAQMQNDHIQKYVSLLREFVSGKLGVHAFEARYLEMFKNETVQLPSHVFAILDALFAEVDAFCDDPSLRRDDELDEEQLRKRSTEALNSLES